MSACRLQPAAQLSLVASLVSATRLACLPVSVSLLIRTSRHFSFLISHDAAVFVCDAPRSAFRVLGFVCDERRLRLLLLLCGTVGRVVEVSDSPCTHSTPSDTHRAARYGTDTPRLEGKDAWTHQQRQQSSKRPHGSAHTRHFATDLDTH